MIGSKKIVESIPPIEAELLLLCLEQPQLNKASSYLWDAYLKLKEDDIEGARTTLRNCLEVLEKEFLPNLTISSKLEESCEFINNLINLTKVFAKFLHYGGPHPGPAPKTSTEMMITLTTQLLKYLAKLWEKELIFFKGESR